MADNRPIGVMDSGMGGLSVVRALRSVMPDEKLIFWGDNKHAPYGVHNRQEILRMTWAIVERILERDVKALVIACNTATSAAAAELRAKLDIPVLGLEPALKPAVEFAGDGRVAVLATEATLSLEKYQQLLARFGRNTVSIPCPKLVELVEAGDIRSDAAADYIEEKLAPYRDGLKAVVLGCTHFVWLSGAVEKVVPGVKIFDGNDGLARYLHQVLAEKELLSCGPGGCELHSTADDPGIIERMESFMRI